MITPGIPRQTVLFRKAVRVDTPRGAEYTYQDALSAPMILQPANGAEVVTAGGDKRVPQWLLLWDDNMFRASELELGQYVLPDGNVYACAGTVKDYRNSTPYLRHAEVYLEAWR